MEYDHERSQVRQIRKCWIDYSRDLPISNEDTLLQAYLSRQWTIVSDYTWLVDGGAAKQFKKDWSPMYRCSGTQLTLITLLTVNILRQLVFPAGACKCC